MANRMRSEAKERLWREQVTSWQRSGLSIRQYCQQHQLNEPNFYAWRRELARRDEAGGISSKSVQRPKPLSVTWMPLTVDPSTVPVVEVQLPTGAILRVPAGVESVTLERILTALHQAAAQEARP
jgi:transposase-like protein